MAAGIKRARGETERHAGLKRLAFLWAQDQGYSACAMEVSVPNCRYRADVAAFRLVPKQIGSTAIFECKQALCDLRRDNCQSDDAQQRLETISQRRQLLERRLRAHYPNLRNGDSLFPDSICLILPSSTTVVTRDSCVSCVPSKIVSTIVPSSTSYFATAARICISSFCLRGYSAIRKFPSTGALLWKPKGRSHSFANQSGTKQQPSITFSCCTESPWPEHERLIAN